MEQTNQNTLTTEELSALLEHAFTAGTLSKDKNEFFDYHKEMFGHIYGESFLRGLVIDANIKIILEKFPNGMERWRTDSIFKSTIETLARGYDSIKMIDELLNLATSSSIALMNHINNCSGMNNIIVKENYNNNPQGLG